MMILSFRLSCFINTFRSSSTIIPIVQQASVRIWGLPGRIYERPASHNS